MTERFGRWLERVLGGHKRLLGAEGWPRPNTVTRFRFETEGAYRLLVWWNEDAEFIGPAWFVADARAVARWLTDNTDAVEVAAA